MPDASDSNAEPTAHPRIVRGEDGLLQRDTLNLSLVEKVQAEIRRIDPTWKLPTPEQREASRRMVLSRLSPGDSIWILAYGSLMYNPAIRVAESRRVSCEGYRRSFCAEMLLGRGTPDRPGLMLAVEPGGRCEAVAHRIAPEHVEEETSVVWLREMISGFYVAEWVDCVGEDGGALPCVAFVADPEHPRIIPRDTYPMAKKAETIAKAVGRSGANRDYLYRVRAELVRLGIRDDYIEELFERVTAITGESGDPLPFGGNVQ